MASVTDAELKAMTQEDRVKALGMTTDQLTGRSMYIEFDPDATERFAYPWAPDVDFKQTHRARLRRQDRHGSQCQHPVADERGLRLHRHPQSARHALAWRRHSLQTEPDHRRFDRLFRRWSDRRAECAGEWSCGLVLRREHDGRYGRHREECRFHIRRRDPWRRPCLQGFCRLAHGHRHEGGHDHRRWRHRCALRLHDAAWPHGCLWQCRQEPRRFPCTTARFMSAARSSPAASTPWRPNSPNSTRPG